MGNGNGTINTKVPTDVVIKRIDDCLLPDEKEVVTDFLEILEAKLERKRTLQHVSREFRECNGVRIVLNVMKIMISDDTIIRMGVAVFDFQKGINDVIMEFIVHGGLDLLQKIREVHERDDILNISVPKLLKAVIETGASAAIQEIRKEALNLQLCHACQLTIEKAKVLKGNKTAVKIPQSSERITRVTMFMENYQERLDVLVPGLDAIICFTENADSQKCIRDTKVIQVVAQLAIKYSKESSIMWRAFGIFSIVAQFNSEVACDILDYGMHELAAHHFYDYDYETKIQQQFLWFFNSCLMWPKSRNKIHSSRPVVVFFRRVFEENLAMSVDFEKHAAKDKFKMFEQIIPLHMRTFMRETKGDFLAREKIQLKARSNSAKRRNFDLKPMYGTVDTEFMQPGEPGLLPDGTEDKEATGNAELDWDSKLNYGLPKKKKKAPGEFSSKSSRSRPGRQSSKVAVTANGPEEN